MNLTKVLALSSWVATGHVGLSAAAPVLQALGHRVTQLPTVILSNHPGFAHVSGAQVPPDQLDGMVQAMAANGWLGDHDALLTGYLPSPAHVELACQLIDQLRRLNPQIRVITDPILGDGATGLYIAEAAATATRDRLVPLADTLTPNAFELGWLTGQATNTLPQAIAAARQLIAAGRTGRVLVTSPPLAEGRTGVLEVTAARARLCCNPARQDVPHGTGDAFSAMIAAGLAPGQALGHLDALIAASTGAPHLPIAETAGHWTTAAAVAPSPLKDLTEPARHGL